MPKGAERPCSHHHSAGCCIQTAFCTLGEHRPVEPQTQAAEPAVSKCALNPFERGTGTKLA
jgi:hypothetical protein